MKQIANILTSKYWLVFSLSLAFLSFYALNRGAVDTWIEAGAFFVLLNVLFKKYTWPDFTRGPAIFFVLLFLVLIASSLMTGEGLSHMRNITNLKEMLLLVLTAHCLSIKESSFSRYYYLFFLLLVISAGCHSYAFYVSNQDYVVETNRNILSVFLIMIIPFLFFYLLTIKKRIRYLLLPVIALLILASLDIFLKAQSRPAIIGLFLSTLLLLPLFLRKKKGFCWFVGLAGFVGLVSYTNYAGVFNKIKELLLNLSSEERVAIWTDSLRMISESSYFDILFGHGLGSFRYIFANYSSVASLAHHVFPHNFPLQLLYESGLFGLFLVLFLFAFIFFVLVKAIYKSSSSRARLFHKSLLIYYCTWVFHCGLTVGFFSKYTLYPLGFTLGCVNVLYFNLKKDQ